MRKTFIHEWLLVWRNDVTVCLSIVNDKSIKYDSMMTNLRLYDVSIYLLVFVCANDEYRRHYLTHSVIADFCLIFCLRSYFFFKFVNVHWQAGIFLN